MPEVSLHHDLETAEDALHGEPQATAAVLEMLRAPGLHAFLCSRGATRSEADELLADLLGDCYGGERVKGGLHRLLSRYNGRCPLPAFLRHVALTRLISLKRKQKPSLSLDDEAAGPQLAAPSQASPRDDALIDLLRDALVRALARVDPEKLVLIRLIESYRVPQKKIGALLGWHETKISRLKTDFLAELRSLVLDEVHRRDPWLELAWDDFLALCGESLDLFAL